MSNQAIQVISFKQAMSFPVSEGSKKMLAMHQKLRSDKSEKTLLELKELTDDFSYMVPIEYNSEDDDIAFPLMEVNDGQVSGSFLPVYTCFGEMYKVVSTSEVKDLYKHLIVLHSYEIMAIVEKFGFDGFIIDSHGMNIKRMLIK